MTAFDLVIKGGTVIAADHSSKADVGIRDGRIVAVADNLEDGAQVIDASDRLVMPGGIESHCHIEEISADGLMSADDFHSGTVSAAFGGNTTIVPFAAQQRGQSLRQAVLDYRRLADPKVVIDYALHMIISDPSPAVLEQELPGLVAEGYTSFKVFMTYDRLRLSDYELIRVLAAARGLGALVMVHPENHDMIRFVSELLVAQGHHAPKFHALSHPRIAEEEAVNRMIALAELVDVPLMIVHVSNGRVMERVRWAQEKGLRVYAETCPQYLVLTAADMDRPGQDGAKFCCSPPLRDEADGRALWSGVEQNLFDVVSSDHAPYTFDEKGKFHKGFDARFDQLANGMPGIEARLPLLFSEGVGKGRISLNTFVALAATNAARLYGLEACKGAIAPGLDADIAIWDAEREVELSNIMLHDRVGYTPYEGMRVKGWPETVISRGRVVVGNGDLKASAGSGRFVPAAVSALAQPRNRPVQELDPASNFGVSLNY
ncbi:MAG: dihydropyrimidinase [Pelagibacterium sp. SCN 63-23]|nr:MAG: dihydropyrimidinase [Pelagibacterium sp. SCN 63-23]